MNAINQEVHRFLCCLSIPVAFLSEGLSVVFENDAFKQVLGFKNKSAEGLQFQDLLSEDSSAELQSQLNMVRSVSGVLPFRFKLADNEKVFFASLSYLRSPEGNCFFIQGKQQLEEHYLRLNKELGEAQDALARQYHNAQRYYKAYQGLDEFLTVLMHDIRSPLSTVWTSLQLAQEDLENEKHDSLNEMLTIGSDSTKRLLDFVDRLYQNVSVGQAELRSEAVDLFGVCADLEQDLMSQLKAAKAKLVFTGRIPVVVADLQLVRQLFQNLFQNAIKFKSESRPLEIEVGVSSVLDDRFEVYVRDNGQGFEQGLADSLFERYHKSSQQTNDGMGIGLATCKMIADKHGWDLRAEGVCGQGSTFYIGIRSDLKPL